MNKNNLKMIINNHNINCSWINNKLHITVEPYCREITTPYANKMLKTIKRNIDEILEHFGVDTFVLRISNHHVDGLHEINSLLLFNDSYAYPIYQ